MNSKHVKTLVSLLLPIVASTIIVCYMNVPKFSPSHNQPTNNQTPSHEVTETFMLRKMTYDDLQLIKAQESFSWDDFSIYENEDIGSGLFVLKYEIIGSGYLLVSGSSLEQNPQKIVYHHADGEEELIYHITY